MGGRGSGSGRGNSARDTRDIGELRQYMKDHHGVHVHASADKVDFNVVREAAAEIESLLQEFPQASQGIHELNGSEGRKNAYASASLNGKLQLNPALMGDQAALMRSYERDVKNGFHPEGTTGAHISSHELGHLLESAMIHKEFGVGYDYQSQFNRINAWNKNKIATRVISEAARAVKKTAAGKGLTNDQLVAQISRYATKNRSEAMAEAVADYRANGSRAKPLSQEIWKILKRELG